jgi:hypothetical protein
MGKQSPGAPIIGHSVGDTTTSTAVRFAQTLGSSSSNPPPAYEAKTNTDDQKQRASNQGYRTLVADVVVGEDEPTEIEESRRGEQGRYGDEYPCDGPVYP